MRLRFYIDEDTGLPHISAHGVSQREVREVLAKPLEQIRGRRGSMVAIGQASGGRYLKVIFVPDAEGDGIFVVTAFEPTTKELQALRRRLKRRGK